MLTKVPPESLQPGSIRHPTLPLAYIERIKAFKNVLGEFEPTSLEETIDSFQRDVHPEQEILIWEQIAHTFQLFLSQFPTSDFVVKQEAYSILIGASVGVQEFTDAKRHLSEEQIIFLLKNFLGEDST